MKLNSEQLRQFDEQGYCFFPNCFGEERVSVDEVMALLTGGFLAFSAQALSVARRRAQFALLRVLGVQRRALLFQVLLEGALVGGIGATMFNPAQGLKTELYPSINVGVGYQLPLGKTFAMRLEARGYATLVNSQSGVFCSGGCVVSIKGDTITQGEALLGLTARF